MKFRFLLLYLSAGVIAISILGIVLPSRAIASSPDDISITTTPENPAPNENTTITLSSYTDDLDSVLITWSVGGKKMSSGIGQKSFSLNAPALGKETTVIATVALFDGDLNETITIRPSIMTLLWEANDSYVPPFYEGKAMPSADSEIKVVALPEIKSGSSLVDPTNMTYDWQLDETADENNSGYGKNYFTYTGDYLDDSDNVSVTATTLDQKYSTTGAVDVATVTPKIEFYKKDANLGTIWEQALSDGYDVTSSQTLQAAPYFISPQNLQIPFLTFTWAVNDQEVNVPTYSKNLLPLILQSGTSGSSKIELDISNTHDLNQTASKVINVQY